MERDGVCISSSHLSSEHEIQRSLPLLKKNKSLRNMIIAKFILKRSHDKNEQKRSGNKVFKLFDVMMKL